MARRTIVPTVVASLYAGQSARVPRPRSRQRFAPIAARSAYKRRRRRRRRR